MHQVFQSLWSLEISFTMTSELNLMVSIYTPLTYRGKYSVPIIVVHTGHRYKNPEVIVHIPDYFFRKEIRQ